MHSRNCTCESCAWLAPGRLGCKCCAGKHTRTSTDPITDPLRNVLTETCSLSRPRRLNETWRHRPHPLERLFVPNDQSAGAFSGNSCFASWQYTVVDVTTHTTVGRLTHSHIHMAQHSIAGRMLTSPEPQRNTKPSSATGGHPVCHMLQGDRPSSSRVALEWLQ